MLACRFQLLRRHRVLAPQVLNRRHTSTLVSSQVELQAARLSRLDAIIGAQQALGALEDAAGVLLAK